MFGLSLIAVSTSFVQPSASCHCHPRSWAARDSITPGCGPQSLMIVETIHLSRPRLFSFILPSAMSSLLPWPQVSSLTLPSSALTHSTLKCPHLLYHQVSSLTLPSSVFTYIASEYHRVSRPPSSIIRPSRYSSAQRPLSVIAIDPLPTLDAIIGLVVDGRGRHLGCPLSRTIVAAIFTFIGRK